MKYFSLVLVILSVTSCSGLFFERSFVSEMEMKDESLFTPGDTFQMVGGDSGDAYRSDAEISRRTPASLYEKRERMMTLSVKKELAHLESRLSEHEYQEYRELQEYLITDSEKIYYLRLPRSERQSYLIAKRGDRIQYRDSVRTISSAARDPQSSVSLGMSQYQVKDIWGMPNQVEVAGDARRGNERWLYYKGGEAKYVYFENFLVNGWQM